MIVIWLPRSPSAPDARIETGTAERSSSPSVTTPRLRSQRCRAPEITVRKTSLTVPPSSRLICFRSSSGRRTQVRRRCGPIGPFSGVSGALTTAFQATSPTPAAASRAWARVRPGLPSTDAARRARPSGAPARSVTPRAATSTSPGSGAGCHGVVGPGTDVPSRSRSNITAVRSAPETPSTRQWWVLLITAKRPSSRPSTSHSSHSGLERSRRWLKIRPASSRSWSTDPGAGSAVWRTW